MSLAYDADEGMVELIRMLEPGESYEKEDGSPAEAASTIVHADRFKSDWTGVTITHDDGKGSDSVPWHRVLRIVWREEE